MLGKGINNAREQRKEGRKGGGVGGSWAVFAMPVISAEYQRRLLFTAKQDFP